MRPRKQYHPARSGELHVYVDGSKRDNPWPRDLQMSAGGCCITLSQRLMALAEKLQFSMLVLGSGKPDSTRAELGAIYVGVKKLLQQLRAAAITATIGKIFVYTDCQTVADALLNRGNLNDDKYGDDIRGEAVFLLLCILPKVCSDPDADMQATVWAADRVAPQKLHPAILILLLFC